MKLLKIPLKLLALPIMLGLTVIQLVCSLLIGLSSLVTGLLSGIFMLGAVAGWINHADPAWIWQIAGTEVFLLLAPGIAEGLIGCVGAIVSAVMTFMVS